MTRSAAHSGAAVTGGLPPTVFAHGFSLWKRSIVRRFMADREVRFIRSGSQLPPGGVLLLWGSSPAPEGLPAVSRTIRLEDGFLRSVGLGADLTPPVSWVMDRSGIYYDATGPSDLERLLQTAEFPDDLLARAARLRERIVEGGLTKYNVGSGTWKRPEGRGRTILVPGQVETDASLQFGAPGIRTNRDLLFAVRRAEPDAHVLYKPHPDVAAGLRARGRGEEEARQLCDELVADADMGALLSAVDEVHVLTSLAGFEALLRGKRVTCFGQPFFSGWGLTTDMLPVSRRTRRLSLDMLVAAALILYPTYVSRSTGGITTPEAALDELLAWRRASAAPLPFWRTGLCVMARTFLRRP